MIEIKPNIQHHSACPYCRATLKPGSVLWQGMHVCVKSECVNCRTEIVEDLEVGHAVTHPYQVDLVKRLTFGNESAKDWLGKPLLESLQNPQSETVEISKEIFKQCKRVVILNCIDYLYGHCLLKLLNVQKHLHHLERGLVVIVPKFLRWLVPEGVAEIWTVNIALKNGQRYYLNLDKFVGEESKRFDEIYISQAHSHPGSFDITEFTRVPKYRFNRKDFKITFIWRQDRFWCSFFVFRILRKLKLIKLALLLQNWKVQRLFGFIRSEVPSAKFAVTGLGRATKFPEWIEDLRVDNFDEKNERELCQVYSESRLVIGVHGSNMLLPSGHAGMTVDLMPDERWSNFAEDILYQEADPRLAAFRYRYLPLQIGIVNLAHIASRMVLGYLRFNSNMTADKAL